jgi:hypothetical protein
MLGISGETARPHIKRIYRKLNVYRRFEPLSVQKNCILSTFHLSISAQVTRCCMIHAGLVMLTQFNRNAV